MFSIKVKYTLDNSHNYDYNEIKRYNMSNRTLFTVLGLVSIFIGLFVYVFFRPNSIVSILLENFIIVKEISLPFKSQIINNFILFLFPDFLWAFSLNSFLHSIHLPGIKKSIALALVTFSFGVIWELMQYFDILSGTGDILDIFMYLAAATAVVIINVKRRKKHEKN